ncbi:jg17192 [Pararge aegeria aegeria]|uniref:XK-related protein n=1 Tax=Pararge aegeria aegeria TaxID=348720 RepID=A0A8S4SFH3_9NEOP|nr:jg17192 [Pararge aegeria aegeria]
MFVPVSRVVSLSALAYLAPHWVVLAAALHIAAMTTWLQLYDRSPFCSHSALGQMCFSLALGAVYLFTYILPVEGRTRYRYSAYYSICLVQNVTCAALWYIYADDSMRSSVYFYPILVLCVVPYVLGLVFMVIYYAFLHPKVMKEICDVSVVFKQDCEVAQVS